MLTRKQRDLLFLIHARMAQGEIAPSFDEMRILLGLKSKSGIHRLINALVERGYLRRLPHRARALEVLRLPDSNLENSEDPQENLSQQTQFYNFLPLYGFHAHKHWEQIFTPSTEMIPVCHDFFQIKTQENKADQTRTLSQIVPPFYALKIMDGSGQDLGIASGDIIVFSEHPIHTSLSQPINLYKDGAGIACLRDGQKEQKSSLSCIGYGLGFMRSFSPH